MWVRVPPSASTNPANAPGFFVGNRGPDHDTFSLAALQKLRVADRQLLFSRAQTMVNQLLPALGLDHIRQQQ
jgi:hypothetical protein